ncbi:MAG TPA: helix-turn-helix transcriptional regulator [Pseudonocardiaceae bacterium]|nr:helix-turn-helix transcriptional regulator [Pseudonocardiaceae bacterium]
MPDIPTGQLIKLYRIDRKKSTTSVATHAGITVRYLEMIEAETKTPTLHVLRRIAKVLGVRTAALLGEAPSEDYEGPVNFRLAELERALITYRTVSLSDIGELPSLEELARQIKATQKAWFTSPSKYSDALQVLPGLIVNSERAVHESGCSAEACRQVSEVYMLTRAVLKYLGRTDLCGMVSDRAMRYAEETKDPLLIAAATWSLGHALLTDDQSVGALDLAMAGAERLEPLLPDGTPEHFSLYGGLQLVATLGALRNGDPWRARAILRGPAHEAALRVDEMHNYHNTLFFGPTNVSIHRVRVEYESGEISEALRLSNDVDISRTPSLERKNSLLTKVAQCYECKGNDTAVFVHLKMAEALCPEDFQHRQDLRNMVRTLLKRAKPSYASEVRSFAVQIGLLDRP